MVNDVMSYNILISCHLFSNAWWGKAEPIYVTAYLRANGNNKDANWRFPKGAVEGKTGPINNIYFNNIKCDSENGIYVSGESADKINGAYFDQVDIQLSKTTNIEGGVYDRRPSKVEGLLKATTSAFYFDHATSIHIRNCSAFWIGNLPANFGHVLESHSITSLQLNNLGGTSAFSGKLAVFKIHK